MTDTTKTFTTTQYVAQPWSEYSDVFSTIEKATDKARARAWRDGKDQVVYQAVAIVEKPNMVNTAKVTTIS